MRRRSEYAVIVGCIWITGASAGIGEALARRYIGAGRTVALSARGEERLQALCTELGPSAHPFPLDVTDDAATRATIAAIEDEVGPVELAILNAGTYEPMPLAEFSAEVVRKIFDVNVIGCANALEVLLPIMSARRRGQVALMASVAGFRGLPYAAAYSSSKAAVIRMAESLQPEASRAGVALSVINPGFVDTPLTRKNRFPMPWLTTPEAAAESIARGLEARRFDITFPWQMKLAMRLLTSLPYSLFFALTRRMLKNDASSA